MEDRGRGRGLVGALRVLLDDVMCRGGGGDVEQDEESMRLEMEMGVRDVEKNVRLWCGVDCFVLMCGGIYHSKKIPAPSGR